MSQFGVVLFKNGSLALRAEKILAKAPLAVRLIPVPRELSSNCGLALRFEWSRVEEVRALLQGAGMEAGEVHRLGPEGPA